MPWLSAICLGVTPFMAAVTRPKSSRPSTMALVILYTTSAGVLACAMRMVGDWKVTTSSSMP